MNAPAPHPLDAHALLQAASAVTAQIINSLPMTKDPQLYQDISHIGHLAVAVENLVNAAARIVEDLDQPHLPG